MRLARRVVALLTRQTKELQSVTSNEVSAARSNARRFGFYGREPLPLFGQGAGRWAVTHAMTSPTALALIAFRRPSGVQECGIAVSGMGHVK